MTVWGCVTRYTSHSHTVCVLIERTSHCVTTWILNCPMITEYGEVHHPMSLDEYDAATQTPCSHQYITPPQETLFPSRYLRFGAARAGRPDAAAAGNRKQGFSCKAQQWGVKKGYNLARIFECQLNAFPCCWLNLYPGLSQRILENIQPICTFEMA